MNDFVVLRLQEFGYPSLLAQARDAPEILYARGNVDLLSSVCFSIVGTRSCTPYGEQCATHFTKGLVSYGFTIVSGLAYGIDAIAHQTAVDEGGKTIAVLGTAIDQIHPVRHEALARRILNSGGLIVSEYSPGTQYQLHHFPLRNRIISGLSLGTLIVEAAHKSGALITAKHAFEQNRSVFALPGDLSRPSFGGNHHLVANDMARLVRTTEDIVSHLHLQPKLLLEPLVKKSPQPRFKTRAQRRLWAMLSSHPLTLDDLLKKSALSLEEILVAISYLELQGYVVEREYNAYIKASR